MIAIKTEIYGARYIANIKQDIYLNLNLVFYYFIYYLLIIFINISTYIIIIYISYIFKNRFSKVC